MSPLELLAAGLGLLSVYYTLREHVWCWPTGLVNVILYVMIFFQAKLYADTLLQVVYIGLQLYGWYEWLHGGPARTELRISRGSAGSLAALLLLAAVGTAAMGYGFDRYTDAALPYWDSAITVLSLIAQWLVARKRLENWVFWIVVDVLAVGVYAAKQLYPTAILYGVYLVMAALGLRTWWHAWIKAQSAGLAAPAGSATGSH